MMRFIFILCSAALLPSCYDSRTVDGFDPEKWANAAYECSTYRKDIAQLLSENRSALLEANQQEIEQLLGPATEHELYARNQKFFHYRLSPPDTCTAPNTLEFLSIRFNAIGLANDVRLVIRE